MTGEPKMSHEKNDQQFADPTTAVESRRGSLRDYEAVKFELASLIREASSFARGAKEDGLEADLRGLLKRLAEDRFYLTLVGQFSRGKTTLMNALLGMDRLPTGVVPVTSVITAVSYNSRERVVMHFEDSNLTHEISLPEIREWITEQGNPGNRRQIELAEVQLPAEILRRGAFLVDTPGLGSAIVENTATTNRFLPQIDALLLVTSFEFPLSQEEVLFLRKARLLGRKLFIAVNKADLCSAEQQREILEFIQRRLAEEGCLEEPPLFAVSAAEALAAKLTQDEKRLEGSGMPYLEHALIDYLVSERYSDLLASTCQRLEATFRGAGLPGLTKLIERLEEIGSKLTNQKRADGQSSGAPTTETGPSLRASSCFVCKRMADATFRFMSQFQYDLSHSREEQSFQASRSGFCTLHSREYARLASPQGIAAGYPPTLFFLAERLRSLWRDGQLCDNWIDEFEAFLPGRRKCRSCEVAAETEALVIEDFIQESASRPLEDAQLPCVCLRHLYAIMQKSPNSELAHHLLLRSATILERTAENMQRFALRHGGLHMELASDDELHSSERALNLLVGQPNVRPVGSD
ncbi:MAG: dynamin family protein [Candidatus Acidiferrales bacterium]